MLITVSIITEDAEISRLPRFRQPLSIVIKIITIRIEAVLFLFLIYQLSVPESGARSKSGRRFNVSANVPSKPDRSFLYGLSRNLYGTWLASQYGVFLDFPHLHNAALFLVSYIFPVEDSIGIYP
jgi:hypothetical protein